MASLDTAPVLIGARDASVVDRVYLVSSPPTISSLNYSQGDTAGGGQSIVITGTNLDTVTVVDFGGSAATITGQTPTTCTVTLPAHAAGTVTVTATNPGGSATTSFEFWTPAQITGIDAYLDANKGVTQGTSAGFCSQWDDQSGNALSLTQGTLGRQPAVTAGVFGTLPSLRFTQANGTYVTLASGRALSSGLSIFFVGKWTSSDSTAAQPNFGAPLTVVGEVTGASWFGFGASAGQLRYQAYDGTGTNSYGFSAGSGLNDGTARLCGVTSDTTPNRKAYVGTVQQGATDSPIGGYATTSMKWGVIGQSYTAVDGFDGDIGAVVIVNGVISGGDLTKLNAWARQRFGTT